VDKHALRLNIKKLISKIEAKICIIMQYAKRIESNGLCCFFSGVSEWKMFENDGWYRVRYEQDDKPT